MINESQQICYRKINKCSPKPFSQGSNFILLHVDIQLPSIINEETVFFPLYIFGALVIDWLTSYTWIYFCALYSVTLVYVSAFMPVL